MCINKHLDTSSSEISDVDEVYASFDMVEPVHDSPQPSATATPSANVLGSNPSNGSILLDFKDDSMETDSKEMYNKIMTYLNQIHEENELLDKKFNTIIEQNDRIEAKLEQILNSMNDIKVFKKKLELLINKKDEKQNYEMQEGHH